MILKSRPACAACSSCSASSDPHCSGACPTMSTATNVYLLRTVHVAVGAIWVGAVVFIAAFLVPSVRAAGPAGGAVMQQLMQARRLPLWIMAAALLTVLSGLGLYGHNSAGFRSEWLGSGPGRV